MDPQAPSAKEIGEQYQSFRTVEDEIEKQYRSLRKAEDEKNKLFETLLSRVDLLEQSYLEAKSELKDVTRWFVDNSETLREQNNQIAKNTFVSVLLDGDSMLFLDTLIANATTGGQTAYTLLLAAISSHITARVYKIITSTFQVRIRIYANMKALASAYYFNSILHNADDFTNFVRGFNAGGVLCDFVDVGEGVGAVGEKLKAWLERDLADIQCRHLLLGGEAFTALLPPLEEDEIKKIALIEGSPFLADDVQLKSLFSIVQFPEVFRSEPLPSRNAPLSTAPIPSPKQPAIVPTHTPVVPASSHSQTSTHASSSSDPIPTVQEEESQSSATLRNSKGQRLSVSSTGRRVKSPSFWEQVSGKRSSTSRD